MAVAERPDAGQGDLERATRRRSLQLDGQIIGAAPVDLAVEGQGDVQLIPAAPFRAGQAGLAARQGLGHVVGNGQGGEQSDHATVGSAWERRAQVRFSLRKARCGPIFT